MIDASDPVLPLFISVEPNPEESLMSVLVRASEANVLGRLDRLKAIAGICNSRVEYIPFTGFPHANVLARLLGIPVESVLTRMHLALEEDAGEYVDWYGTQLPRRWIESRAMRFSPKSLRAGDHHQAIWSVKALTYCPSSMDLLVSACGSCGRKASWATTKSTMRCAGCGGPFTDCPTKTVPVDLREDARHVADLVSPDAMVRARAVRQLPPPFDSWEPGDAFHAVVELGFIANNPRSLHGCTRWKSMSRGGFDDYSVHDIVAGYRFIRDWPGSLENHLTNLTKSRSGTQTLMGTMGKYFGQHAAATPLGDLFRQEVPSLLRKIDAPIRRNQFARDKSSRPEGAASASDISEMFKIDKKVVARLSASSNCCLARSTLRSGVVLYLHAAVARAVELWRGALTFNQAARELGVPAYCIDAFVDAGLLIEVTDADVLLLSEGTRLISKASLNVLASRLDDLPLVPGGETDVVPLLIAMIGILHPTSWVRAVEHILNGQLKLVGRRQRSGPMLSLLLVSDQDLEKLKAADDDMSMPEVTVSGMVAADMLGVSNTLVSGAVKLGLVQGRKTRRRIEVPLSEVRRYRREFIGAEEVVKKTGVRAQDFSAAMRSNGYEPLGQAYNTYFWRRADAKELYPSQL